MIGKQQNRVKPVLLTPKPPRPHPTPSCHPCCLRGLQALASHRSFCSLSQPCPVLGVRAFILGFEGSCAGGLTYLVQSPLRTSVSSYQVWKEGLSLLLFSYFCILVCKKTSSEFRSPPTQPHTNVLQNLLGLEENSCNQDLLSKEQTLPRPVHPPEGARPVPPHCPWKITQQPQRTPQ